MGPYILIIHNVNFLSLALEFYLNQLPVVNAHVVFVLYWSLTYLVFSWIYFEAESYFFYFFININSFVAAPGYVGLFCAVFFFHRLISSAVERWKPASSAQTVPLAETA